MRQFTILRFTNLVMLNAATPLVRPKAMHKLWQHEVYDLGALQIANQ